MNVLIVATAPDLGALWARALERLDLTPRVVDGEETAVAHMRHHRPELILADLDPPGSGALTVADYAAYRHPNARVIFVTASRFSPTDPFSPSVRTPAPSCRHEPPPTTSRQWPSFRPGGVAGPRFEAAATRRRRRFCTCEKKFPPADLRSRIFP